MKVTNSLYVNNLASARVKGGKSEFFKIDSGVRQGCIRVPLIFNVYMGPVMKGVKMEMGMRGESGDYLASCMQIQGGGRKD